MSNKEIPEWLQKANKELTDRQVRKLSVCRTPQLGDIRVAETMEVGIAPSALVLVTEVDPVQGIATVALVSNDVDLATDEDLRLGMEDTGLTYDIIVQTDILAPVWFAQIGSQTGALRSRGLQKIRSALNSDWAGVPPLARGLPMRGEKDTRWSVKGDELQRMQNLASECAFALAQPGQVPLPDPRILLAPLANDTHREELIFLSEMVLSGEVSFPFELMEQIGASGWEEGALPFRQRFVNLLSKSDRLADPGISANGLSSPDSNDSDVGSLDTLQRWVATLLERGQRSMRLITTHRFWSPEFSFNEGVLLWEHTRHGRFQVVPEFLEVTKVA